MPTPERQPKYVVMLGTTPLDAAYTRSEADHRHADIVRHWRSGRGHTANRNGRTDYTLNQGWSRHRFGRLTVVPLADLATSERTQYGAVLRSLARMGWLHDLVAPHCDRLYARWRVSGDERWGNAYGRLSGYSWRLFKERREITESLLPEVTR